MFSISTKKPQPKPAAKLQPLDTQPPLTLAMSPITPQ
jgi:hypothetical protein